jgi:alkylhydroperoxidase/carboxymuconolactone decarboxylase family protein
MIETMIEKKINTLTGPVLVFGGAYSNLQALTALRAEAERRGIAPQNVICTGDTAGYCAEPEECLNLLEDWGCHAIAGNVETNLVNGQDDCGCGFGDGSRCDMFAKLWYDYAARNVQTKGMAYMAGLPDILRFTYAGKETVILHGSPRNQSEFIWRSTPAELKQQFLADLKADVAIGGHCGLPFAEQLTIAEPSDASFGLTKLVEGSSDEGLKQHNASSFWLNAGVIGMPANDGTPRTWFLVLDDANGFDFDFHPLDYDHVSAKSKMISDRRLPVSYAATLTTGVWDNTEIMPETEEKREGIRLEPKVLKAEAFPASSTSSAPAAAPKKAARKAAEAHQYNNPKDIRTFGKIVDWQPEMGNKFFDWYGSVTTGDTALSEREKALIALAVSHAIQCSSCVDAYTTNALQAGADEEQMMEAVHVAAAIKAGSTMIYARQMQRQVDKVTM